MVAHFGNPADVVRVLDAAGTAGIDSAALQRMLNMAVNEGWRDANRFVEFFQRAAAGAPSSWSAVLDQVDLFLANRVAGVALGSGSNTAAQAAVEVAEVGGGTRRIILSEYDLNHFLNRHTFEEFQFVSANIKPLNTFFAPPMSSATMLAEATAALQDAGTVARIEAALVAGEAFPRIPFGSYMLGVDTTLNRLTMFYPTSGGIEISRDVLRGIRAILGL